MVVLLGLAAAVLYGGGDFLGGMATRRAHVLTVLTLVETVAVILSVAVAWLTGGPAVLTAAGPDLDARPEFSAAIAPKAVRPNRSGRYMSSTVAGG